MTRQDFLIGGVILAVVAAIGLTVGFTRPEGPLQREATAAAEIAGLHLRATYDPLHFKPAIELARDEQCLVCHKEVLEDRVRETSPAGVQASWSKAWYQRVATYEGEQETFHRRHLTTPLAQKLMKLKCNTCHEGHDPREEAPGSSASVPQETQAFTLRKQVNPETTCLKCHGRFPDKEIMGLPGPWEEVKDQFQNDCLVCHAAIRTHRHRVNYLDAEAIEAMAKAGQATQTAGDVCYGCHGGRAWYRIAYPYPRHPWPGMSPETPVWAKNRPLQSEARFTTTRQSLDRFLQPKP
ncbi:MAG: hypothetical protein N2441_04530 [Rhodocyclaceae bacterium]|nr:hypothetical protein [Rhodocyclaceae bacterium]